MQLAFYSITFITIIRLIISLYYTINILNKYISILIYHVYNNNLEPYAIKVACTVLKGGNFNNKITYLNRPFAALLLLNIGYNTASFSV